MPTEPCRRRPVVGSASAMAASAVSTVRRSYTTEPHRAGGEQQVLAVTNKLVARERASIKK